MIRKITKQWISTLEYFIAECEITPVITRAMYVVAGAELAQENYKNALFLGTTSLLCEVTRAVYKRKNIPVEE